MSAYEPPRPASPASSGNTSTRGLSARDISIPELDRKEAARKQADVRKRQAANPQAPDDQGLNSSGLPSAQAYYSGSKSKPLHTSVLTPIIGSRLWIKILAVGALVIGFFWVKESIYLISASLSFGDKLDGAIRLVLSFFFFIKPAHKLWLLTKDLNELELERNETALADVLYTHSRIWKYAGITVLGAILYALSHPILGFLQKMLSFN